jgi:MFS family permease
LQLWGAQFLGQVSQNVVNYALIVLINVQTGSTLAGGVLVILFSIPAILLGPLPGMLVDRVGRWWVLWLANLMRALLGLSMGLILSLVYGGAPHGAASKSLVILLYAFSLLLSLGTRFYLPAESTAIPRLVSLAGLAHGLALFGVTFVVAQAVGLVALGPLLDAAFGWPALFYCCLIGFGLATVLSLLLPRRQLGVYANAPEQDAADMPEAALLATLEAENARKNVWEQAKAGWQPIAKDSDVLVAVVRLSLAGVVIALISELAPNFVVQVLRRPPNDITLVLAPAGIALIVGAILAPRLANRMGRLPAAALGVNGLVLAVLLLALNRPLGDFFHLPDDLIIGLAVVEASLLGFALNLVSIPCQAVIQERVLPHLRGSVLAFQQALFNGAAVPILLAIGLLADDLGIPWALLAVAVLVLILARLHRREARGLKVQAEQAAEALEIRE